MKYRKENVISCLDLFAESYFKNIKLPPENIALETKMIDVIMDHHITVILD